MEKVMMKSTKMENTMMSWDTQAASVLRISCRGFMAGKDSQYVG